jgi:hypothetical protein
MSLRTIQRAKPLPHKRIKLAWDDASEAVVDLLHDPVAFNAVAVGPRGRTLVWRHPEGDEVDLCADALWHLAHEGTSDAA